MAKEAEPAAVIIWEVGLARKLNSELLPPPPVVEPTVRRGEITQPFATINRLASKNANVRIENLFSQAVNKNESHTFGLPESARCLPEKRKQLVRSLDYFVKLT
jgi:hypothetical protein